eukprot:TRINITY_DN19409_c0_g1_i1.p1 TRINITY_DN19409_c0_g1~~TRINITY_DN19409_c0_g1_i1.p1  ORF type:complete len:226 (+),score=35.75 TRINITY_DN19409_c0_g1_i1:115-792(+)
MTVKQNVYLCFLFTFAVANFILLLLTWVFDFYSLAYTSDDKNQFFLPQNDAYILYKAGKLEVHDYVDYFAIGGPKALSYDIKYSDCPTDWCDDLEAAGGATFGTVVAAWVISLIHLIALAVVVFRNKRDFVLKLTVLPIISLALALAGLINWSNNGQGSIKNYLPIEGNDASYEDRLYTMTIVWGYSMVFLIIAVVTHFIFLCMMPCARVLKDSEGKDVHMESRS